MAFSKNTADNNKNKWESINNCYSVRFKHVECVSKELLKTMKGLANFQIVVIALYKFSYVK